MSAGSWLKYVFWDSTWGNNTAWAESAVLAAGAAFVFRRALRRQLERARSWWHEPHREHLAAELAGVEKRLAEHAERLHAETHRRLAEHADLGAAASTAAAPPAAARKRGSPS